MSLLKDKICLVTGGTRGIGKSIVLEFARQGATVAFTYRSSASKAEALEAEIKDKGQLAKGYQVDAGNFEKVQGLIDDIIKEFGRLDVIVNNAGITKDTLLLRMGEEHWDEVIQTNLNSVFYTTKAALSQLKRAIRDDQRREDLKPGTYRALADAYYRLGRRPEADAAIAEAHFAGGNVKQAVIFAKRAKSALKKGTATWRRMDEIIEFRSEK